MDDGNVSADFAFPIYMWSRSEWHRHNLNRKLKELPPVSEEEFRVSEGLA